MQPDTSAWRALLHSFSPPLLHVIRLTHIDIVRPAEMADAAKQTKTVFVGGLDHQVTQQTLHDAFIPFGEIVDVSLPKPELQVKSYPHQFPQIY